MTETKRIEGIDWRPANRSIWMILGAAIFISILPRKDTYFGFVPWLNAMCGITFLFYCAMRGTGAQVADAVRSYQPATVLDAKRANEQIKLVVTTINAVALATAAAFGITEYAKNNDPNYFVMLAYVAIAFDFHRHARNLLGLLKDEAIAAPLD